MNPSMADRNGDPPGAEQAMDQGPRHPRLLAVTAGTAGGDSWGDGALLGSVMTAPRW